MISPLRGLLKSSEFLTGLVKAFRQLPRDLHVLLWRRRRVGQIRDYFDTHATRCVQIGCGKNLIPGWLNADYSPRFEEVIYLDATKPFPFPDNSVDYIFTEHMIEHVTYTDGQKMLKECHRVLKPGGRIRVSTPNLRNIASLMSQPATEEARNYIRKVSAKYIPLNTQHLPGFVVNNFFWDFWHLFVYDPDTLRQTLEEAGFAPSSSMTSGKSTVPDLCGLERHQAAVGADLDAFETMIFEGIKI